MPPSSEDGGMSGLFLPFRALMRYADFNGRSNRAEIWAFFLLVWVIYGAFYAWALIPLVPVFQGQTPDIRIFGHLLTSFGLLMLFGLLLFLPILAAQVRRLHDSNRTGWWVLLPTGLSLAGQQLVYVFNAESIMKATMRMNQGVETTATSTFDFASVWGAYWPLYQIILPWTFVPSLLGSVILLIFYLLPGSRGDNRFGPKPGARAAT
jgi:uncharacterized membrane protein YhaH (DUF805 family)